MKVNVKAMLSDPEIGRVGRHVTKLVESENGILGRGTRISTENVYSAQERQWV